MSRFFLRQYVVRSLPLVLSGAILLPLQVNAAEKSTIFSPVPSALRAQMKLLGPVPERQALSFTVWLKLEHEKELQEKIAQIYDPKSRSYQHFVTPEQFEKRYAPSRDVLNDITDYFKKNGFQVRQKNRFALEIQGDVKAIERLFHVKLNRYQYEGEEVYTYNSTPTLSSALVPYVSEVTGLSTLPRFKPFFLQDTRHYLPTTTSFAGFTGAQLQTAYDFSAIPLINNTTIDGTGQTIVLIDGCTSSTANQLITGANSFIGSTPELQPQLTYGENFVIMVNGQVLPSTDLDLPLCSVDEGWAPEINLDMQASHTTAPGAKTVLVIDNQLDVASVIDTITSSPTHTLAGFDNANILSNSWGAVETSGYFPSYEAALQLAAASGLSVNFSTGDCGDDTNPQQHCGNPPFPGATPTPGVNYPASSSWSTAVGGTSLFVDSNWNYAFETAWGNTQSESGLYGFYAGAGGGISQMYAIPSWQAQTIRGFQAGGYPAPVSTYRALPDIAMLADNMTGLVFYDELNCGGLCPRPIGGTSLSAPLYSGVVARINQIRTLQNQPLLGLSASYLYSMNRELVLNHALNAVIPPHLEVSGAVSPVSIGVNDAPLSSFAMRLGTDTFYTIFSWDSSLTIEPSTQPWSDAAGAGTPNVSNFVMSMAAF